MKRLIWIFLLASASSQTFNTNIIPAQTGLSLGRQGQRWNLYANNLDITGSITVNGSAGHFTIFPLFGTGHTAVSTDLTSSTPGQCAFWIAGNMLGQGPCLTAVPTPTLGDCAIWATTTTLSSLPCSGGGGSGDIKSLPVSTQTIAQPYSSGRTSFNPNVDNDVVKLNQGDTTLNWSQSPTTPATLAAGSTAITLASCPKGLSTKDHYVYIAGTGTPELAKITAFSCVPDAASGTITVTVANAHSAGYTVGTASSGLKEASEYAKNVTASPAGTLGGLVRVSPGSVLTLRGTVYITAFNQTIDFQNAEVDITADYATYTCGLRIGDTTSAGGAGNGNVALLNATGFKPTVPAAAGVCLHSQGTYIDNLSWMAPAAGNYWQHFLISLNDQSSYIGRLQNYSTGSANATCTATDCPSVVYGPGTAAYSGILHIADLQLTLANKYNAVENHNGNTLTIDHCILQNLAQFGIYSDSDFGENLNLSLPGGCYFESVGAANPKGLGGAALILQGGISKIGVGNYIGNLPRFANTGATPYYYWIVPRSAAAVAGSPQMAGYALLTTTGTHNVIWYDIAPGGSFDVLRMQQLGNLAAPTTNNCTGGSVAVCGSIATGLVESSVCNATTHVCTFTDDISVATTAYTVSASNLQYGPVIDFWPSIVTASGSGETTPSNTTKVIFDNYTGNDVTHGGLVAAFGPIASPFFALRCALGNDWSSTTINCMATGSPYSNALWLRPQANGLSAQQGAISFAASPGASLASTDLVTLLSADRQLTFATAGLRPAWQAADSALGYETAGSGGTYLRDNVSIRGYIGKVPDNAPQFKLLSTTLNLTVPIALSGVTYNFSGPEVSAPSSPAAGLQRAYFKAGVGLCAKDSAGVEYCPGGSGLTFATITAGTNTTAAMVVGTGSSLAVSGSGTIAATTAAAFASNPTDCGANTLANVIAANGNLTCVAVAGSYMTNNTVTANQLAAQYSKWLVCTGKGMGDGLNAMPAGTYLETTCRNLSGVTVTFTAIQCFTDNNGTSTMAVTNGAGTALLTGAVTCNNSYASGTQSGTTTLANNDFLKFTYVADGTSKQFDVNVLGTF